MDHLLAVGATNWYSEVARRLGPDPTKLVDRLTRALGQGTVPALALEGRVLWDSGRRADAAGPYAAGLERVLDAIEGGPRPLPAASVAWALVQDLSAAAWKASQEGKAWGSAAPWLARVQAFLDGTAPADRHALWPELSARTLLRRAECLRGLGRDGELAALEPAVRQILERPSAAGLAPVAQAVLDRRPLEIGSP